MSEVDMSEEELFEAMSLFQVSLRRVLLVFMYGMSLASWDSYFRERDGSKVRSRYFLVIQRAVKNPPGLRLARFWSGRRWVKKELRARTYSYLGAWCRAFWMARMDDIVIMRRPESPREWCPS